MYNKGNIFDIYAVQSSTKRAEGRQNTLLYNPKAADNADSRGWAVVCAVCTIG